MIIQLTDRQKKIVEIVKEHGPITSENIATMLGVTRATLRPDFSILTMSKILDARPKVGYYYVGLKSDDAITKTIKSKLVKDIMTPAIIVTEETSVYDTIVTIFLEDVGTIFVTNNNCLSGVISRKDLLKNAIGGVDINKVPVGIIMTRMPNVIIVKQEDSVLDAAKKIIEHEVDSLPVVEMEIVDNKEIYKILGKLSKTNITKLFVDLAN